MIIRLHKALLLGAIVISTLSFSAQESPEELYKAEMEKIETHAQEWAKECDASMSPEELQHVAQKLYIEAQAHYYHKKYLSLLRSLHDTIYWLAQLDPAFDDEVNSHRKKLKWYSQKIESAYDQSRNAYHTTVPSLVCPQTAKLESNISTASYNILNIGKTEDKFFKNLHHKQIHEFHTFLTKAIDEMDGKGRVYENHELTAHDYLQELFFHVYDSLLAQERDLLLEKHCEEIVILLYYFAIRKILEQYPLEFHTVQYGPDGKLSENLFYPLPTQVEYEAFLKKEHFACCDDDEVDTK